MEKFVEVVDENSGRGMDLIQYEEVFMPKFYAEKCPNGSVAEKLKQIKEMSLSEGDVLLCSFPKTGTHWTTNLISLLLHDGPMEKSPSFMVNNLEVFPVDSISSLPSPKVVHTHFMSNRIPVECFKKNKVVLVVRNPKDTAVSMFCHIQTAHEFLGKQSWDHFQRTFLSGPVPFGPFADYYASFERMMEENKEIHIHVVYYENMKKNGLEEMRKLQRFLGLEHSDERLVAILDRCSLKKLRDDVLEGKTDIVAKDVDGNPVIYRKGEVGDWKNFFTVAQSEAFDAELETQMKDSMFQFQFS